MLQYRACKYGISSFFLIFPQPNLTSAQQYRSSTQNTTSLFEFLDQYLSVILRKGDGVHILKRHMASLGYLNRHRENNIFDDPLESAIKKYQGFFKLSVTGVLDVSTISSLRRPRCGMPDFSAPGKNHMPLSSLYSLINGRPKWSKTNLKYHIRKNVARSFREPIEQALLQWQSVTKFKFTHVSNSFFNRADIIISFEKGNHNCSIPFIRDDPSMAHAFKPPIGRVHFNADKNWASNGDKRAYDLQTIALHQFGHTLGLDHSNIPSAIMFPELTLGERKGIYKDDIQGIKALYGF